MFFIWKGDDGVLGYTREWQVRHANDEDKQK